MKDINVLRSEKARLEKELETMEAKRLEIMSTGQSYEISNGDDNRKLSNVSLKDLNQIIASTKKRIADLEYQIARGGKGSRYGISIGGRW